MRKPINVLCYPDFPDAITLKRGIVSLDALYIVDEPFIKTSSLTLTVV